MKTRLFQLLTLTTASIALALLLISCQQSSTQDPATELPRVNTAFTATTQPTTRTAQLLGFSYAPAPFGGGTGRSSIDEVRAFSKSCLICHSGTDAHSMHDSQSVKLACIDCHGGKHQVDIPANLARTDPKFQEYMRAAHVTPKLKELWPTSANPQIPGALTLEESPDYIRFVNPGDLRTAQVACAACHWEQTRTVPTSMMAHGAMLWGAALYNNGSHSSKSPLFGEGYTPKGEPAILTPTSQPTTRQSQRNGMLTDLWPLPRWEITQPGNILRVFERGGKSRPVVALPNSAEDPGKPEVKLSARGLGTDLRTDPVFIGLQKTRLLDPTLNLFGTNDHPGDYRASGCSACHVVYANDKSPVHSARWSKYGNQGQSFSSDTSINSQGSGFRVQGSAKQNSESGTRSSQLSLPEPRTLNPEPSPPGHPIEHKFVKAMPTSTCIVCHIHPGTNVLNSYLGYMWWDNESDAQHMYPRQQRSLTAQDEFNASQHNPEGSAARGLWYDPDFLQKLGSDDFNAKLSRVQFADFHGHGWVFRAVFKQDRHGQLLDHKNQPVTDLSAAKMKQGVDYHNDPLDKDKSPAPPPDNAPVHLKDIHLERGMQCVDCHFAQDSHGDGNLYGETRGAVMVECADCHGDAEKPAAIFRYTAIKKPDRNKARQKEAQDLLYNAFTGAAAKNTTDADAIIARNKRTADNHFDTDGLTDGKLWQKSALDKTGEKGWWVPQIASLKSTADSKTRLADYAHTLRKDSRWGAVPTAEEIAKDPTQKLAHGSARMSCYACHSSWNTSCFGCHLPQQANQRKPMLHNEGELTRNYTRYNYQTLRDDVYMLGVDSSTKNNKIVPIRSACAVLVSSQDTNRQWLYSQQQTISAEGYAGTAFSPYFPHTVRTTETKQCADCHLSKDKDGLIDNNATLAQLMLQGTHSVNFIGRWAWVAQGNAGLEAVAVTELSEPQAVIGSNLHKWAYPDNYAAHQKHNQELEEHHHHDGTVLDLQMRGEYVYAACGKNGFIAYDIANIENKGFSERIITAPVSPLGQRLYVKSKYATSICSPSTLALDPTRESKPDNLEGKITDIGNSDKLVEQRHIHPLYAFLYLTDAQEGLIVIGNPLDDKKNKPGVATLLDGDPENNFLQRALTFNPDNLLKGAKHFALHGHYAYVACDAGVVVLDMNTPLAPRVVKLIPGLDGARKTAFQFRYAFILDKQGMHVFDVTNIEDPKPTGHLLPIADARDIYLSRTYAYIAAGKQGLLIADIERPEVDWSTQKSTRPDNTPLVQSYNANGALSDTTAVKIAMTNASLFAYVADGNNGLAVLQLTSPDDNPTYGGFSPKLQPVLIARHQTKGPALAISEGLDRDRAVDESGHQLSVFGRKGARPFTLPEMQSLYLKNNQIYTVSNTPTPNPIQPASVPATTTPTTEEPKRSGIPRRRPSN